MIKDSLFRLYNRIRFRAALQFSTCYPVISNVNAADEASYSKRALLIYVVRPFLHKDDGPVFLVHQNFSRCKYIAAILGELGYIVDAVDVRDIKFRPLRNYDLIISNRVVDTFFKDDMVKIYLATTINHTVHNRNMQKRHQRLCERRKYQVEVRRMYPEVMPYVMKSHAIIAVGNEFTTGTWKEVFGGPIYSFYNYGFKETGFLLDSKDFLTARSNFLFFASGSQVQKGLDLLLEIFPRHPDLHLYICSRFKNESDFCACYHKELYETSNIHPIGWVTVNSPEFYDLIQRCAYVIHPSSSDGQSGSVVQCMYSGLIPLVTREAGIDTEDFGVTFCDDGLEEIERVIVEVSELPESWHRDRSIKTRRTAEDKYSEDAFMNRWRNILTEIVVPRCGK